MTCEDLVREVELRYELVFAAVAGGGLGKDALNQVRVMTPSHVASYLTDCEQLENETDRERVKLLCSRMERVAKISSFGANSNPDFNPTSMGLENLGVHAALAKVDMYRAGHDV